MVSSHVKTTSVSMLARKGGKHVSRKRNAVVGSDARTTSVNVFAKIGVKHVKRKQIVVVSSHAKTISVSQIVEDRPNLWRGKG